MATLEQTHDAVAGSVSLSSLHLGRHRALFCWLTANQSEPRVSWPMTWTSGPMRTPWLAGVFVSPEARGRGHVIHLIQAVEAACRAAASAVVWPLYRRCRTRVRACWMA